MSIRHEVRLAKLKSVGLLACGAALAALSLIPVPEIGIPAFAISSGSLYQSICWSAASACAWAARRVRKPRAPLLWLRRFHVETFPRYPMYSIMKRLSDHGVMVCTLRDSKVQVSKSALQSYLRENLDQFNKRAKRTQHDWQLRITAAALFGILIGMVSAGAAGTFENIFPIAYWLAFCSALAIFTIRQLARERRVRDEIYLSLVEDLKIEEHEINAIDRQMAFIASGFGLRSGVYVFDVVDAIWMKAVTVAAAGAKAALVDVSELTENMHFELEVLAARFAPEAIVVAWGVQHVRKANPPKPEIISRLEQSFGRGAWDKFNKFPYQLEVSGVARTFGPMFDSMRIRDVVFDAIDAQRRVRAGLPPKR